MNDSFYNAMDVSSKLASTGTPSSTATGRPTERTPGFRADHPWRQEKITINIAPLPNDKHLPSPPTGRSLQKPSLSAAPTDSDYGIWRVGGFGTLHVEVRTFPEHQIEIETDQAGFASP